MTTESGERVEEVQDATPEGDFLVVMGSVPYEATREALYKNTFRSVEDEPWPTALLERAGAVGRAQLRPVVADAQMVFGEPELDYWSKVMWRQCEELSDLDADVLDALSAIWLHQARSPRHDAVAEVSDLLDMRGLAKKRSGDGREGGYRPKQREAILNALWHIQNLWLNVARVDPATGEVQASGAKGLAIQSRAFVITDRMGQLRFDGSVDVRRFVFRPGKVFAHFLFGPGRQTALLAAKALQYDPYREQWEKRLARFFSWQWRVGALEGDHGIYAVRELLEAIGEEVKTRYPSRTRNRLEEALGRLREDGVIDGWHYDDWEEATAARYQWSEAWRASHVCVRPPQAIAVREGQVEVEVGPMVELEPPPSPREPNRPPVLGDLRAVRKASGLTQTALAEILGVSQGYLSRMERGKVQEDSLSEELLERVRRWVGREGI